MQLIAVRDIGRVVAAIFDAPGRFADSTVEIAGGRRYLTWSRPHGIDSTGCHVALHEPQPGKN
ncbi:hypothetical protein [Promicromonospora sp. NPDC090134]|uniref:hypothetical protein n=1 Tax=Promicromonospora sp. NPDC090134 TaxID=3364408 RepID=UPI0038137651